MRAALLGLMVISLSQTATAADTMRCGDRLVATGALAAEVIGVCGEPVDRRWRRLHWPRGEVRHEIEEWTYNFGPDRLLRVLRFRDGILADIEEAGYGFDPL